MTAIDRLASGVGGSETKVASDSIREEGRRLSSPLQTLRFAERKFEMKNHHTEKQIEMKCAPSARSYQTRHEIGRNSKPIRSKRHPKACVARPAGQRIQRAGVSVHLVAVSERLFGGDRRRRPPSLASLDDTYRRLGSS
jgi:hypothetical protein